MYSKSVLTNGIRVVTEAIPYLKSVTFGVWVGTGSRNEYDAKHGISHFIEHLMFKGTTSRSAKDIAEEVDSIGGQLNAFTGKEYTCYYMKVLDTHLDLAMDVISDMLLYSKFDQEDLEREKGVVLEEYNMYEDSPDELVHDLYVEEIWRGNPLGHNILGTPDSIQGFTREAVLQYLEHFYTPDNIVIAATGNLTHDQVVAMAQRYFAQFKGSKAPVKTNVPRFSPTRSIRQKDTEQAHVCLGTIGVKHNADELYCVHILNNILGGSMSSRLFQAIREDRGLAYSVYSYQTSYRDAGLLTVYAGAKADNVKQVAQLIWQNMLDMREKGVTDAELYKAKEQLKGNLLLGLESSSSRMSRLGTLETTIGKYITLDEVVKRINEVSVDDLRKTAEKLFVPQVMSYTILGPVNAELTQEIIFE